MADKEPLGAKRGEWRQVYSERRFNILLVILSLLLAGSPVFFGFGLSSAWFDGLMASVLLAAIQSLCFERPERIFALLVGIPALLFCLGGHALSGTASFSVLFFGHLCGVLFFFGSAGLIVKSLFNTRLLTFDSIFGAVCGYLFLGLGWAMSYSMIETFQPGSFQISQSLRGSDEQPQPYVLMYYSFVTLTTVGYGDVTPASPTTRTFAWIEAITGQFYLWRLLWRDWSACWWRRPASPGGPINRTILRNFFQYTRRQNGILQDLIFHWRQFDKLILQR